MQRISDKRGADCASMVGQRATQVSMMELQKINCRELDLLLQGIALELERFVRSIQRIQNRISTV